MTIGINRYKQVQRLYHKNLKRISDDSAYKSACPFCAHGTLMMVRDFYSGKLLAKDACLYCGQNVTYIDINELQDLESKAAKSVNEILDRNREIFP